MVLQRAQRPTPLPILGAFDGLVGLQLRSHARW
jgi:hypothetical protein